MRVIINTKHGGLSLSETAVRRMAEMGHEAAIKEIEDYDRRVAEFNRTGVNPDFPDTSVDGLRTRPPQWYGFLDLRSENSAGRADPILVRVVEEMGVEAAGARYSDLAIIEVPDDVSWHIEEYDGWEWVAEDHRTWHAPS